MWKVIGRTGEVERMACWKFILKDKELPKIIGRGNQMKGKAMLESMKAVRALDKSGDGMIYTQEFRRLYLPFNLLAAEEAVCSGLDPIYLHEL